MKNNHTKAQRHKGKNPWLVRHAYGTEVQYVDVGSRLGQVREANARKLKEMIEWPDTQKTVRLAAERRLRKITVKK